MRGAAREAPKRTAGLVARRPRAKSFQTGCNLCGVRAFARSGMVAPSSASLRDGWSRLSLARRGVSRHDLCGTLRKDQRDRDDRRQARTVHREAPAALRHGARRGRTTARGVSRQPVIGASRLAPPVAVLRRQTMQYRRDGSLQKRKIPSEPPPPEVPPSAPPEAPERTPRVPHEPPPPGKPPEDVPPPPKKDSS